MLLLTYRITTRISIFPKSRMWGVFSARYTRPPRASASPLGVTGCLRRLKRELLALLMLIHQSVSIGEEVFDTREPGRVTRNNPNAEGEIVAPAQYFIARIQLLVHTLEDCLSVLFASLEHKSSEFVTSNPRKDVGMAE